MNQNTKRIAITGIGLFSPIGIGKEAFWQSISDRKSGIGKTELHLSPAAPDAIGGEVLGFTDESAKKNYLKGQRKSLKVMCRETQLGVAAALQAVEDAGLNLEQYDKKRIGIDYGANLMMFNPDSMSDSCAACVDETGEFHSEEWGSKGLASMEPLWMLKYLPNMPACHIAIFVDSQGPNNSVTLDEASPGVALTEAFNIMQRGAADLMLVGGTGSLIQPVRAIHCRLYDTLGLDTENPSASSKPFDTQRNGQVLSEGAACLVLETEESAQQRGATIYGYLLGGGSTCVADIDGNADIKTAVVNAANAALRKAGIDVSSIGHVNAHGLATPQDDAAEAEGLKEVLGEHVATIPVTGQKGYFGNAGAATGLFEIVASLMALKEGKIPPTLNCTSPDASLGLKLVGEEGATATNDRFLKVNFTHSGQASAVVIEAAK